MSLNLKRRITMLTPEQAYRYLIRHDIPNFVDLDERGRPFKWYFDTEGCLCGDIPIGSRTVYAHFIKPSLDLKD